MADPQANVRDLPSKGEVNYPSRHRFAIINGDDFGFSRGVNRAIIEAHDRGVLTSTSLMVTGEAFDEAIALAQAHPKLAVGLHLVVVSGKAVLPQSQIPHLVDSNGCFRASPFKAGLLYQFNSNARRELRLEIRAQLEKFRQTGLELSHVDGHKHLHMHPVVLRTLVELADEFNIKAIRLPSEELAIALGLDKSNLLTKVIWWWIFARLRGYGEGLLKPAGISFAERVYGLLATGRMSEEHLLGLIPQIRADFVEIYSHPAIAIAEEPRNGPPGAGQIELDALLSDRVREVLVSCGFELTTYNSTHNNVRESSSIKKFPDVNLPI